MITIRHAVRADVASLEAIGHSPVEALALVPKRAAWGIPPRLTLVAESSDAALIASTSAFRCAGSRGGWACGYVRVKVDHRGIGVGRVLQEAMDETLARLGGRQVMSFIHPDNTASRRMFRAVGYREEAVRLLFRDTPLVALRGECNVVAKQITSRTQALHLSRQLGWAMLLDDVSTREAPLGMFPPVWPVLKHELRSALGRGHPLFTYWDPLDETNLLAMGTCDTLIVRKGLRSAVTESVVRAYLTEKPEAEHSVILSSESLIAAVLPPNEPWGVFLRPLEPSKTTGHSVHGASAQSSRRLGVTAC